jgi:hypothetical protein
MTVDYTKLLAAPIKLDIDYLRLANELLIAKQHDKCVPFSYKADQSDESVTAYSLFLRNSKEFLDYSYRGAKLTDESTWEWDTDLVLPYTKEIVNSIPFKLLGAIRVVYFPDIPCIKHTDWDNTQDQKRTLGLSIIPSTGETHCNIWSERLQKDVSIPGHAMLLNDSVQHWVPTATGTRITMRIFGEIDYTWFDDKIDQDFCFYL